jgi:type IV secretion system protein VirB4
MIFIDETQPMMEDPVFSKQVGILLKEHRKLRGSVSLCFQDVNAVNSVILEQCQTRFLFPNASASKEAYAKFELTDFEWDYIKGFSRISRELKRSVLVKKPGESVILNIDMSPLGNLLQLYRSGSEPVKIVKELQQQWGMKEWVSHYLSV